MKQPRILSRVGLSQRARRPCIKRACKPGRSKQAMLEMESYARPLLGEVAQLTEIVAEENEPVAAARKQRTGDLKLLLDKMKNMEAQLRELQQPVFKGSGWG